MFRSNKSDGSSKGQAPAAFFPPVSALFQLCFEFYMSKEPMIHPEERRNHEEQLVQESKRHGEKERMNGK